MILQKEFRQLSRRITAKYWFSEISIFIFWCDFSKDTQKFTSSAVALILQSTLFNPAPSPPRRISVKYKEKTRLVLQWRRPEETNGVLRKYELHFTDGDQVTKTYTVDTDVDKEYVTYEMTLPDVEAKYKIKVSKNVGL